MTLRLLTKSALFALATLGLPAQLAAQSTEEVKSDVLSALSTPLPITVIGPLLTRDVTVTEEGDGFRATLLDTSLMGLFPFGEVSIKLEPLDDDTYRVSDLQFPRNLDFPGLATITFDSMDLDGTWSATERSYSALKAELTGLQVDPGQGALSLGSLAFDVEKEPDETDTESRFDITMADVSATGLGGPKVTVGAVQALLRANGDEPVDLYSLLREVMMLAGRSDGGAGLMALGQSLLGNTYGTVTLELEARDLNMVDPRDPENSFFRAADLQAGLDMQDVSPRDWGLAELSVHLDQVQQQKLMDDSIFDVDKAVVRLRGAELPVADMFAAITILGAPRQTQPIRVSDLLDGLAKFGAIELATEGKALRLDIRDGNWVDDNWVEETVFSASYDKWGAQILLEWFNKNQGVITNLVDLQGGTFIPGPNFPKDDLRHVNAWFPKVLKFGGQVSNLNEGFLKQLFRDVLIQDLNEPLEIILPLALYAAASTIDVAVEGNRYETGLFGVEQSGQYRVYPAKVMSFAPIEGQFEMRLTGFDALAAYIEEIRQEEARREDGDEEALSVVKSVLTVLRNLGKQEDDGSVSWEVEKADVDRSQVTVNGTTLYYPEFSQFIPLAVMGSAF